MNADERRSENGRLGGLFAATKTAEKNWPQMNTDERRSENGWLGGLFAATKPRKIDHRYLICSASVEVRLERRRISPEPRTSNAMRAHRERWPNDRNRSFYLRFICVYLR